MANMSLMKFNSLHKKRQFKICNYKVKTIKSLENETISSKVCCHI